jgi:hypothetical protein
METSLKLASVVYVEFLAQHCILIKVGWQVNLSGGQKARGPSIEIWRDTYTESRCLLVSLARAVYSRASILLLDDVLSAGVPVPKHHIY